MRRSPHSKAPGLLGKLSKTPENLSSFLLVLSPELKTPKLKGDPRGGRWDSVTYRENAWGEVSALTPAESRAKEARSSAGFICIFKSARQKHFQLKMPQRFFFFKEGNYGGTNSHTQS